MTNEVPPDRNQSTTDRASAVATASREEASSVAQNATAGARDVAQTAREQAQHVGDAALDRAQDVLGDVRGELRARAGEQGDRAARALHDTSSQLHTMADSAGGGLLADVTHSAASRVEDVASRLDQGGVDGVLDDVRSYARRRPGMFLLAATAAGFVVGRLVRNASSTALRADQPANPTPAPAPLPASSGMSPFRGPEPEFLTPASPSPTSWPQS